MTLKLHHLRPAPGAKTAKNRVGRGEGSKGKTAGRGTKGTKARNQVPASFEGGQMPIHMRLPKLKGFKNPFKVEFQVVNLDRLGELFPEGGPVGEAEEGVSRVGPSAARTDVRHGPVASRGKKACIGHYRRASRCSPGVRAGVALVIIAGRPAFG